MSEKQVQVIEFNKLSVHGRKYQVQLDSNDNIYKILNDIRTVVILTLSELEYETIVSGTLEEIISIIEYSETRDLGIMEKNVWLKRLKLTM